MNRRSLLKRAAASAVAAPIAAAAALLPAPDSVGTASAEPALDAICTCGCTYGEHYTSNDGTARGCIGDYGDGSREGCCCDGFEPYVEREPVTSLAQEDYDRAWSLAAERGQVIYADVRHVSQDMVRLTLHLENGDSVSRDHLLGAGGLWKLEA